MPSGAMRLPTARLPWVAVLGLFFPAMVHAQTIRPWMLRVEAGPSRMHADDRGMGGALRLSRSLDAADTFRVELGLSASAYQALDAGIQARLCRRCRVSPFLGVGAGALGEDEYAGWMVRATGGVEAPFGSRIVVTLSAQLGYHGGENGPHLFSAGLGYRFGRPRGATGAPPPRAPTPPRP